MEEGRVYKHYRVESEQGVDHLPETPAIHLSPFFQHRFYAAIEHGLAVADEQSVPVVLLGLNLAFDPTRLDREAAYVDVTQYFGIPYQAFRRRYSLGWDGHPNPSGNRLLAHSVLRALKDQGQLAEVSTDAGAFYDKRWYWQRYDSHRDEFIARQIAPYIDFERFQNIHQLVGGLLPPRRFPLESGGPVSVILKRGSSQTLHLVGLNSSEQPRDIAVEMGVDGAPHPVRIDRGAFELAIPVSGLDRASEAVVDVRLRPQSEPFEATIRLDYLGLVPRNEAPPRDGPRPAASGGSQ